MSSAKTRQMWRSALAYGLGAIVLGCGYLLVYDAALDLLVDHAVTEMGEWARLGGEQLEEHLGEVVDDLRGLVNERARGAFDADTWALHLERFRSQRSPLVRAVVAIDEHGAVSGMSPHGWSDGPRIAADSTVSQAEARAGIVLSAPIRAADQSPMLLIALAIPGEQEPRGTPAACVVVVLDLTVVEQRYVAPLARRAGETALLLGQHDSVLVVAENPPGRGSSAPGRRSASLAQAAGLVVARASAGSGDAEIDVLGHTYLFGRVVPISAGGAGWSLAVVRAKQEVLGEARRLLLLSGFFAIAAIAAGAALISGSRRSLRSREIVEREAARWRQVAEEARHEERWQVIAEDIREPVVFIAGLEVVGANGAAVESLAEGSRSSLLGVEFLRFVAAADRSAVERRLVQRPEGIRGQETVRATLVTAGGRRRVAELAISGMPAQSGSVTRLSWQDLTARERAEALLRGVSTSVPVAVLLLDEAGKLVWSNRVFSEMTQYPADRFVGELLDGLVEPRGRRRAAVTFSRAVRGRPAEAVVQVRRQDGDLFSVAFRAIPVFVGGELYRVVVVAFDAAAAPAFAGWNRLPDGLVLADLARLLSHRLNNDLQALIGLLEKLDGDGVGAVSSVSTTARGLVQKAIAQLQQFSMLTRSAPGSLQAVSLGALLESWRDTVSAKIPTGVRLLIRREVADGLVHADAAQLTLLLDLALAAALPRMEGGGTFEVSIEPSQHPGAWRLSVFDTGYGGPIDPRSDAPTGMLTAPARTMVQAVARLVARRHGGSSGSRSGVGLGNRLWCDLVLTPAGEEGGGGAPTALVRGKILLADDEELVRSGLADALRREGYEVEEVSNGAEVVDRTRTRADDYALVVLDLVMPVMDGREAFQRLREESPQLPVLLCTGYEPASDPVLNGAAVLVKPFTVADFLERVEKVLQDAGAPCGKGDTMAQ